MKVSTSSVKLATLVSKIRASHRRCLKALRSSLEHARETGNNLIEAQATVKACGLEWIPWVQENCEFSVSQAQRYKRIADRYKEVMAKAKDRENLTMSEALRLLSPRSERGPVKTKDMRFPVSSESEFNERAMDAAELGFEDGSREQKFVQEKIESLARQVLGMAKAAKLKGDEGKDVEPVQVALALVHQLRKALQPTLVVMVSDTEGAEDGHPAKPAANGHKPVNRLNGKLGTAKSVA